MNYEQSFFCAHPSNQNSFAAAGGSEYNFPSCYYHAEDFFPLQKSRVVSRCGHVLEKGCDDDAR